MTPRFTSILTLVCAIGASLIATAASAADAKKTSETKADAPATKADAPATKADAPAAKADAPATADPDAPGTETPDPDEAAKATSKDTLVADAEAGSSPVEQPGQTYLGVGLRYRAIIVPKFMMNLFGDGGRTVVAHGIGPEFTVRKNAFEYEFSALFASYAMDPTPFKASSDTAEAWEIVQSKLKVLYLTADFVWSHDFAPEFALNYGVGAGLGFVWGDLLRTQAYPGNGVPNNTGDGYLPCIEPNKPHPACGGDNNHYHGYTEPSWANGGSKPIVFPWLALQTGFRYKPHRNFIARFDAGFGTSGFFLGLGADYGL